MSATMTLQQEIADTLEALSSVLAGKLVRSTRNASAMVELARLNTRLRQLQQWLPAGSLTTGLEKLQRLLPALLQPQEDSVHVRLLAFVLRLLQGLPASQWVALGTCRKTRATALPLLVPLLRWQQTTSIADDVSAQLAMLVDALASAWRSQGSPREIADLLLRIDAVMAFAGNIALRQQFARCAQQLTLVRMNPTLIDADALQLQWCLLWTLPQLPATAVDHAQDCNDLDLWQAVQTDLSACRWQLQQFLQQARHHGEQCLPYDILLLHYRLPWIVAAAGNAALADYFRLSLHLLLAYWRPQLPLPNAIVVSLFNSANLLDLAQWQTVDTCTLARQQLHLLALSPEANERNVDVNLSGKAGAVPLGGIPDLLATTFEVLMRVRPEWFASPDALALHAARLEAELRLLEQGSAAIRMTVVETMASLLLALLRQVQRAGAMPEWPAQLLWCAHQHLLDLLDEAAAWQPQVPDQALLTQMRNWLRQAQQSGNMLREPQPGMDALLILSGRLHQFVDALALTLDQPVHFTVAVTGMLPAALLAVGETVLQTVLREEILTQVQSLPQRRQVLKPRSVAMQLQLEAYTDGLTAELNAEGSVLDAAALKRLRRNLPPQIQQLYSEELAGQRRKLGVVIGS